MALGGATEDEAARESDQLQSMLAAKELFETFKNKNVLNVPDLVDDESEETGGVALEIPLMPDMYGADPLEICLMQNAKRDFENFIFVDAKENMQLI